VDERLEVDAPAQLPQRGPTATIRAGGMQQTLADMGWYRQAKKDFAALPG
jgi:hypothetical protein